MNPRFPALGSLAAALLTALTLGACSEPELTAIPGDGLRPLAGAKRQAPPDFVPEFAGRAQHKGRQPGKEPPLARNGDDHSPQAQGGTLDRLMAWERQDYGVRPPRGLHQGESHGATPSQLPGGQVITTKGLLPLLQQGLPVQLIDVLGVEQTLPRAIRAPWAAAPGDFEDETQQRLAQFLDQRTRGNPEAPLVFFCAGPECWLSYNAALRAVQLGYRNVLWYRGGLEAWHRAGQRFERARQVASRDR